MVTKNSNPTAAPSVADLFASAAVLDGFDLRDKAELVNVEFLITSVRFQTNASKVNLAYFTAMTRDGEKFEFSDSSTTGARAQVIDYLTTRDGSVDTGNTGEIFTVTLLAPKGLRVSNYEVTVNGKSRPAKTYYLTAGNK